MPIPQNQRGPGESSSPAMAPAMQPAPAPAPTAVPLQPAAAIPGSLNQLPANPNLPSPDNFRTQ